MGFLVARVYNSGTSTTHFYEYDFDTHTMSSYTAPTAFENYIPALDSLLSTQCAGLDLESFYYGGGAELYSPSVYYTTTVNSASCCTLVSSDFQANKTNNTSMSVPTGTIVITSSTLDINDYEATIDSGATWVGVVDGAISFTGLVGATYPLIIRNVGGVCTVSIEINILDNISYPPLIIEETEVPDEFSPVFYPIQWKYTLQNGTVDIDEDGTGTYLSVDTSDGKDFFATYPIFRILSGDYIGTYKITAVDDIDDPEKFYFSAPFTVAQSAYFVPFGQQIFYLYAESTANVFTKVADIAVSANTSGEYIVRVEGFLQSRFEGQKPTSPTEVDLSLSRKYYIIPKGFDLAEPQTTRVAVFSAIPDLDPYLEDLTPLGPLPINFINEVTQKGFPVLFSYIDQISQRVNNAISSYETDIVTTAPYYFMSALPGNTYSFTYIGSTEIGTLTTVPELPDWITVVSTDGGDVVLKIETFTTEGGEYTIDDYLSDDYSVFSFNGIVGCYSFEFFNDGSSLFTLDMCVYPASAIKGACSTDNKPVYNLAWINREGGWSSYVFEGKKEIRREIGRIGTFKRGLELKKSFVDNVYTEVEVHFSNKGQRDMLFIASLRTSIQAYMYNDLTLTWDIPIFIDKETFPVYNLPFKQAQSNGSFVFKHSEELLVQRI
jgi:hypothetical protein